MTRLRDSLAVAAGGAALVAGLASVTAPAYSSPGPAKHVLLLSVDGLHQSDLTWYVQHHPGSALAGLVSEGIDFTNARTPVPSDSFPGLVAQVTGGNPRSTGIYYDDSWNAALLPAGTKDCSSAVPGVEVTYFEAAARNPLRLDSGQGLNGLPGSILHLTPNAASLIDPTTLPVDPASCQPVYPHSYLRVNTIFEVARTSGLRTAWSDKHAAYEVLNGPSGTGVEDLFTPEINSAAPTAGSPNDWTTDNALTQQYDSYKVQAVVNEINGYDHSGSTRVGTPAIFGMNFQTVSTAEKLPASDGLPGGYLGDGVTPGPLLSRALDYINRQVASMVTAIRDRHIDKNTVIILSAKHGQSPMDPATVLRVKDGPILDGLNAAWAKAYPTAVSPLVAQATDDDGMLIWLHDRSSVAVKFARDFLLSQSGTGTDINLKQRPSAHSGLTSVLAGDEVADYFHVQPGDPRVPDVLGFGKDGVIFTGKLAKIAEHGGAKPQDRNVPLVVSGDPITVHGNNDSSVETTEIAPTILSLLGLNPDYLQSVQIEGTPALPVR